MVKSLTELIRAEKEKINKAKESAKENWEVEKIQRREAVLEQTIQDLNQAPSLLGSEKQIAWAEQIRFLFIMHFNNSIAHSVFYAKEDNLPNNWNRSEQWRQKEKENYLLRAEIIGKRKSALIKNELKSSWHIENRNENLSAFLTTLSEKEYSLTHTNPY